MKAAQVNSNHARLLACERRTYRVRIRFIKRQFCGSTFAILQQLYHLSAAAVTSSSGYPVVAANAHKLLRWMLALSMRPDSTRAKQARYGGVDCGTP